MEKNKFKREYDFNKFQVLAGILSESNLYEQGEFTAPAPPPEDGSSMSDMEEPSGPGSMDSDVEDQLLKVVLKIPESFRGKWPQYGPGGQYHIKRYDEDISGQQMIVHEYSLRDTSGKSRLLNETEANALEEKLIHILKALQITDFIITVEEA